MPGTESDTPIDPAATQADESITGLPAVRSWNHVYAIVVVVFIVYATLLAVLSRAF